MSLPTHPLALKAILADPGESDERRQAAVMRLNEIREDAMREKRELSR